MHLLTTLPKEYTLAYRNLSLKPQCQGKPDCDFCFSEVLSCWGFGLVARDGLPWAPSESPELRLVLQMAQVPGWASDPSSSPSAYFLPLGED